VSLAYLKEQMGHSQLITIDIYGHLLDQGNRDAADMLGD
jgi:integrase